MLAQLEEHPAHGVDRHVLRTVRRDAPLTVVALEELLEGDGHLGTRPAALADVVDEGGLLGEIHDGFGPWVAFLALALCRLH